MVPDMAELGWLNVAEKLLTLAGSPSTWSSVGLQTAGWVFPGKRYPNSFFITV